MHHDLHILWGVSLDTGCQPPRVSNILLLISFLASDNWAHPWLKLAKINKSLSHYMQKGFASKTTEEAVTTVTISQTAKSPSHLTSYATLLYLLRIFPHRIYTPCKPANKVYVSDKYLGTLIPTSSRLKVIIWCRYLSCRLATVGNSIPIPTYYFKEIHSLGFICNPFYLYLQNFYLGTIFINSW